MRLSTAAFLSFPTFSTRITTFKSPQKRQFIPLSTLNGPDGLPNFRDLATASPNLRPGILYRGSTPAALPPDPNPDVIKFLHSVPTFLDLRSKDERISDDLLPVYRACGQNFHEREIHQPIMNKRKLLWGLLRVIPPNQARTLCIRIIQDPLNARKGVTGRLDQGGLILLNKILVDAGGRAIGRALYDITDALQEEGDLKRKVYFYCSAGKDRTGLLAALILKLMDVKDNDIISDYARSSETWENGPFPLRQEYCGMFSLIFHNS